VENNQVHQPRKTEPRFFYGYIVVVAALLIILLHYGTRSSFGVFFKPLLNEFDWTRALTSGAFTLSMLMQGVGSVIMGRLNDKYGPRAVMTLCSFFLGLGYLLMSLTSGVWHLYLFYGVIIGISMGGSFVALLSTVARWFVKRRGMMTGIVIAGMGIGTFIMTPMSNWLISIYNWRTSYIILGVIVLVTSILATQFLKRDPKAIRLVPYGADKNKEIRSFSGDEGYSLKEAAGTMQFWMVMLIYFCLGYFVFTVYVHLVPHITDLGISATNATNVLAVMGAFNAIGCIVLGGVADRLGSRRVITISFILVTAALFWLVPIREVWMLYLFAIIYGIGSGGGAPVESTVVAELFGMKSHGSIFGLVSCSFTIGSAIGPLLAGYLFDVNGSYQMAFLVCAGLGIVGVMMAAILRPTKKLGGRI